jgi:hypothetical protein
MMYSVGSAIALAELLSLDTYHCLSRVSCRVQRELRNRGLWERSQTNDVRQTDKQIDTGRQTDRRRSTAKSKDPATTRDEESDHDNNIHYSVR